jgi:hypothetical protein
MARQDTEAMLWFANRWWWFPGTRIGADSEFEWRDNRVYLLESNGNTLEGVEVNDVIVGD